MVFPSEHCPVIRNLQKSARAHWPGWEQAPSMTSGYLPFPSSAFSEKGQRKHQFFLVIFYIYAKKSC